MAAKSLLSQQILRNLGDRSYEKRKQAALEIEDLVRLTNNQNPHNIPSIITILNSEYIQSTVANNRKGGLIGLSAVAIALSATGKPPLEWLIPPVVRCLNDNEARVRYYACESLYNIIKVARGQTLEFFNEIFDGLCKLFADVDVDVKSGGQLLDRLMKDVVVESPSFSLERFIPLLRERVRVRNAFVRQLLLSWVVLLESNPDIDLVEFLPEFLGGLLSMLSDSNKDIRQQAFTTLASLLQSLCEVPNVTLGPMAVVLVEHSSTPDSFTKLTILTWLIEFCRLNSEQVIPLTSSILQAALPCLADAEKEIRLKATKCTDLLLRGVEKTNVPVDLIGLYALLAHELLSATETPVRLATLRWFSTLFTKYPRDTLEHLNMFFPSLLRSLQDHDDNVLKLNLEVISRLALDADGQINLQQFELIIVNILTLLASDIKFLEARAVVILRHFSALLDGEAVYIVISRLLKSNVDTDFTIVMVQTLSLILLSTSELSLLRSTLKNSKENPEQFQSLYSTWVASPVATISLCLLAEQYSLSSLIAEKLADIEITVGMLLQLDRLVQLIESPVLVHVRLHLLQPHKYPHLRQTLHVILALLPQSTAFTLLDKRLTSCSPQRLGSLDGNSQKISPTEDKLLQEYLSVQKNISEKRRRNTKLALLSSNSSAPIQ